MNYIQQQQQQYHLNKQQLYYLNLKDEEFELQFSLLLEIKTLIKLNLLKGNTVGAKKKTKAKPTFLKAQLQLRDRVINLNHSRIITRTSIDSNNLSEFSLNTSVFHSPAVSILKKKTATSKSAKSSSKSQTKLIPSINLKKRHLKKHQKLDQ